MHVSLPEFPPLFPSGGWWRVFAAARLDRFDTHSAIGKANASAGVRPREWMRTRITGGAMLSIPVAGGASTLKNRLPSSWRLAREAAREMQKFESTLATVYGRQPYFALLRDDFSIGSYNPTEGEECDSAERLCNEAFIRTAGTLGLDDEFLLESIRVRMEAKDSLLRGVCNDLTPLFNPELSIVDAIVRLGPDAIFLLIPAF